MITMAQSMKLLKKIFEIEISLTFLFSAIRPSIQTSASEPKEYCQSEYFNVTCDRYEVIVMETAEYGRMKAGRCVTSNLGCSVNVLGYFDRQCSGRKQCSVYIADATLHKMAPCSKDYSSYLEAKYTCITVSRPTDSLPACRRDRHVTLSGDTIGHLASVTSLDQGYGLADCPWRIVAGTGQTVRLTLMSFGGKRSGDELSYGHLAGSDPCYDIGDVRESGSKQTLTMCSGTARERVVYSSTGNDVMVQLLPKEVLRNLPSFVIKYQVHGCQSMKAPAGGTLKIDGNTATIRCNRSKETWYLTCTENQWIGHVGNCTDKSTAARSAGIAPYADDGFPYGILVVVAIGVALGVLIGGVLLSFVAYYMKRQSHLRRYTEPGELTKQIMDETESAYGAPQHHHRSPTLAQMKGPSAGAVPGADARYVQDLPYNRTLIAYTDDDPAQHLQYPHLHLQRCTCPKGSGLQCVNPSCHGPVVVGVAPPSDVFGAAKTPGHLYEMPEST